MNPKTSTDDRLAENQVHDTTQIPGDRNRSRRATVAGGGLTRVMRVTTATELLGTHRVDVKSLFLGQQVPRFFPSLLAAHCDRKRRLDKTHQPSALSCHLEASVGACRPAASK